MGPENHHPQEIMFVSPAPRAARLARPSRPSWLLAGAVLALIVGLGGCTGGQNVQNGPGTGDTNYVGGTVGTTAFKPGQRPAAPNVSGTTLTRTRLSLASYRGKVVVLNFWASWCAPCRAEAPALSQLSRTYRTRGVQFIGVNIKDSGRANGAAYERHFGISYPSLYDPAGQILLAFRRTVPPSAIPSTLVVDPTGRIADRVIGGVTYSNLKGLLDALAPKRVASAEGG
jgi:thiol-disulfide isomerase/thioredoxin